MDGCPSRGHHEHSYQPRPDAPGTHDTRRSDGRAAVTHWKVLKSIEGKHGKFSLLEMKIETGRTHQIRVHLASLGHPVAGDALYGAPRALPGYVGTASKAASMGRHYLHSFALQFRHPISNKPLSFEQPLPAELKEFLDRVGIKDPVFYDDRIKSSFFVDFEGLGPVLRRSPRIGDRVEWTCPVTTSVRYGRQCKRSPIGQCDFGR